MTLDPSHPASSGLGKEMWPERWGEAKESRALKAGEGVGLDSVGEAEWVDELVLHLRSFWKSRE